MKSMLKSLMSVAVAALAFTSCSTDATEDVMPNVGSQTLKVNATIDQTRTVMADDHVNLKWSENDEIKLYIGESAAETDAKTIKPLSGGTITNVTYEDGGKVYARYTSYEHDYQSKGVTAANIEIPKGQQQTKAGVFNGVNLPMVASAPIETGTVNLKFEPVGCVLVFNVYNTSPAKNPDETIKSIQFETTKGCSGYTNCSLIADPFVFTAYEKRTTATVTLDTFAPIGVEKPTNTTTSENQVYLVVAQAEYEAATFTVTTNADKTYTFKTASGIDCSKNTARVVNLNLANAPEMQPEIEVPSVLEQESAPEGTLAIDGIKFKNIATAELVPENVEVGVYSNVELTEQEGVEWLTIVDNKADLLAKGTLHYNLAKNESTEPRTAYIGIKCAGVQAAISITQVASGASTAKYYVKVTEDLDDWTGDYLIVYEAGALAFNGDLTSDQTKNNINVKITDQGILSEDATNAALVKISKIDGGYILQAASDYYLYSQRNENKIIYNADKNTASKHPNSIAIENGNAMIRSNYNTLWRFNDDSGQKRFRYYKTTSSSVQPVQLYKLQ